MENADNQLKPGKQHKKLLTWPQQLRYQRMQRGWSQADVAEKVGTDVRTIRRWEYGEGMPRSFYLQKLAELFGKNLQELGFVSEIANEEPKILPTLWNVPYRRSPFFIGREEVLKHLHNALRASKTSVLTQPQAISGLGGSGKTQIAMEYAYRHRDDYSVVLWVKADTYETLTSDFVTIADSLKLPEKNVQDRKIIVNAVKQWLEMNTNWLLIFDNADDLAMAYDFLPSRGKGHILLTTRAQATGGIAQGIEIEKMGLEEGALFLLHRAGVIGPSASLDNAFPIDRATAEEIVQILDGLPLALDQAGAYIEETGCDLADYLSLYHTRRTPLLKRRGGVISDHPEPVATTWSFSFQQLEQASPAAADILRLCAFLHPNAIPQEIITEGASDLGPVLQTIATDPFELDAAIEELRRYSLVRRNPKEKILSLHPLVQVVLRDEMDEETKRQWAERAVRTVNRVFPDVEDVTLPQCQKYLLHAQTCATLIKQWDMEFPEAARLLSQLEVYSRERV